MVASSRNNSARGTECVQKKPTCCFLSSRAAIITLATVCARVKQAAFCVTAVSPRVTLVSLMLLPRDILSFAILAVVSLAVLFLHRASCHALFSINAVPLRDTSRVSCVTLCRFRGVSCYIGVISCLVTRLSAPFLSPPPLSLSLLRLLASRSLRSFSPLTCVSLPGASLISFVSSPCTENWRCFENGERERERGRENPRN